MNVDEGQHILEEVQGDFMRYVNARAIAQKTRIEEIIPEAVEIQINESKSSDAAKQVLFEHLHDQVTLEGLRHFCSIMIESKGYQRMQMFGKELLAKLEEVMPRPGSSQVSSAPASDVEMEGGIEQRHMLGKVRRKRPPEDHVDCEWKRQKDSDSADCKAVVTVDPAYDVETLEERDYQYLKKAIENATKNTKTNPHRVMKTLYHHTYHRVVNITANYGAERFWDIMVVVRTAIRLRLVKGDIGDLDTAGTVADVLDVLHDDENWKDTELLEEIVNYLPEDAKAVAVSLLDRYNSYLKVFQEELPVQELPTSDVAVPEGTRTRVEITVAEKITEYTSKDCKIMLHMLLHICWQCPHDEDIVDVGPGSTIVVFLIDKTFTENIIQYSATARSLWAFQELRVTRVRVGAFELNVVQLLTQHFKEALRSGLTGSMDFVGATKALPYQVYALVDPDISEKLVIRTVYRKIAHPCPEQELASGTVHSEGVETTPEMYEDNFPPKVEEEAELDDEGKIKEATESGELLSRAQELEDELKNLTHKNMALENNLKVCQEHKDHTEQEIASLKERLVSMLSSQGGADKDSAMTAPSGVCSKRIPRRWWLKVSAGSYDTSLLPSSPMEQAEGSREMEGEVVFRRDTKSNLLKAVSGTEWMYRRGALERGRQANLRRHQFTRYHRHWLADNVQKEEEDSCKLWLLQLSPDVGTVRKREEHGVDEGKMSEEVTGSGEALSRVQELEDELKDSEQKRMDLIQNNTALQKILKACREQEEQKRMDLIQSKPALQKILKACREQEVRAQQEIASLWERLGGADQDSAPNAPSEGPLKRIPHRWWLKVSAGSYDTSLLLSSPMEQTEGSREMEGEVVFRRDTTSNLLKAVSGTEWMYRRGALERGRRSATANLHQHKFTRYHRSWLADNVQKEEEESCKQWLLQSSPDVGSVTEGEDQGLMSKVYKQALRDYQEKIGGVLIVENIISDLEPYLTKVEYLQVESKSGNMAQVDELFRILLTKGNRHFKGFCHVLEDNGYQHWAQQLQSSTDGAETEALNELFTRHLLTAEEFSELARKGQLEWEDHLTQVLLTKPAEVVQEACQVLEKHGFPVKKKLKTLNELFTRHLLTAEEFSELARKWSWWEDHLDQVLLTKPAKVVQEACQVLEKHGYPLKKKLKTLNALFNRHLLTAKECSEVARKGWRWEGHLTQVLLTKPAEVVHEACQVMEKHGCHVKEDLKMMSSAIQVPSEPGEGESDPHEEPEPAAVKGFTEGDCSILYHKALRDNPTITLHVSKAMTIGPPRAGKTALRHHLLELEPPEVSSSTPVMKTAETISVYPSGSAALPGDVVHVLPSRADQNIEDSSESEDTSSSDESDDPMGQKVVEKSRYENRMFLVTKNKWVLVNNDSGILSLLTHLRDTIAARSSTAQRPVDYETGAEDNNLPSTHETSAEDSVLPNHPSPLIKEAEDSRLSSSHDTEEVMLPSTHESLHREAAIQPSGDKSDSVALMSSQVYRELQNPDLADVALSDAHLLQFLDCGGQLAYHDILPLFVNIPTIYLNVFNVTDELTECPIDELCSTEGNTMYTAKSALSLAEMVARSVMTVCSLADRKVPLLPDVTCESKPRVILVGTHLDKLDEKDADKKLKASNEILKKALQLKSNLLERAIVPNEKSQLMFFPVNNKLYVDKSHQSHKRCKCKHCCATRNLKRRITKQAKKDAVKVEVPVRWYLYQLLELSQSEKPFYSYSELYERCRAEGCVTDVGEFHAMVTYFHALGLLIHLCGADVGHTEESACLVFTNPSHLFENISKLYLVQFEDVRNGDKILLKHEGKLTRDAVRDLGVQLNPDHFMDFLVQLFIGAEIKSQEGGRVLFVPSVLTSSPDDAAPSGVSTGPQEESLGFAVTFENTSFIPCGVFTGMSTRLQNAEGWKICTDSISRKRIVFAVGPVGTVTLFDHATHISVKMHNHKGKCREYRDTVIKAVADSYCFLFHSKSAKDPRSRPCSECLKSPYLVLGQTCENNHTSHETCAAPHVAELKVVNQVATSVHCQLNQAAKELDRSECDLFQNMSHYAVVERQHTCWTLEGAGSGGIPPSQTGSETPSNAHPPIGTCQTAPDTKKAQTTSTAGKPLENRVLMECETRFFEVVAAKEIYRELCQKHVIPQTVADKITNSHSVEEARGHLFDHMRAYGTIDTLKVFCDVITSEKYHGFQAMQDFGAKVKRRLEQEGEQTH